MTPSLGGTQGNCAGGITPWGTWLSCEEVGSDAVGTVSKEARLCVRGRGRPGPDRWPADRRHGPLRARGGRGRRRHRHRLHDRRQCLSKSGFYRYIPDVRPGARGTLALGGVLQMARVQGVSNANLARAALDARLLLEWVDIADPDQARGNATGPNGETVSNAAGPFVQGWTQGALRMNRGEGIWYAPGKMVVMDTVGGRVARGSIWELDLATQTLRCIYASPGALVGNMGDNLTVSPRNAILICEDASSAATDSFGYGQRLMGLTAQGNAYIFAKNNVLLNQVQLAVALSKQTYLAGDHRGNEFMAPASIRPGATCSSTSRLRASRSPLRDRGPGAPCDTLKGHHHASMQIHRRPAGGLPPAWRLPGGRAEPGQRQCRDRLQRPRPGRLRPRPAQLCHDPSRIRARPGRPAGAGAPAERDRAQPERRAAAAPDLPSRGDRLCLSQGSVTPTFGTLGTVSYASHAAALQFGVPEYAEFHFGNPLALA
ncbi:PhoX family protein [Massilia sp. B-10]|nr:PhoX family protein [Massilia sp. B-10]